MRWTPELIRKMWPKSATIRPPRKDKIKDISKRFQEISNEIRITTKQNKSYVLTLKNHQEIIHIKFVNDKTCKVKYWSLYKCFKCQRYIRPYEHNFVEHEICLQCLTKLIQEAKREIKFYATVKKRSRKILL